jgi:hypothetical protein
MLWTAFGAFKINLKTPRLHKGAVGRHQTMTVALPPGALTRDEILALLQLTEKDAKGISKHELVTRAFGANLISEKTALASCDQRHNTTPMYLRPYVTDPVPRDRLEALVQACSRLYRRGSFLVNNILSKYNPHPVVNAPPPPHDLPPYARYEPHPTTSRIFYFLEDAPNQLEVAKKALEVAERGRDKAAATLASKRTAQARERAADTLADAEVKVAQCRMACESATLLWQARKDDHNEQSHLKQVMLPEYWPTSKESLHPWVQEAVASTAAELLRYVPDWRQVMQRTGWSQMLNRLGVKYGTNMVLHVTMHLYKRTLKYLQRVELAQPEARPALVNAFRSWGLPVLAVHDDDYATLHYLRAAFGAAPHQRVPWNGNLDLTQSKLDLHLFFVSQRVANTTLAPIAARRRHFVYVDAKIARNLLPKPYYEQRREALSTERRQELERSKDNTLSVGEAFGLTADDVRRKRKLLRQRLRRKHAGPDGNKRFARKWHRLGHSNVPKQSRFASFETDGVALHLCLSTPVELKLDDGDAKKKDRLQALREELERDEVQPVLVGVDTGRAKLLTAAVSVSPIQKPTSMVYTRRQYYFGMHHHQHKRFEAERRHNNHALRDALEALSDTEYKTPEWTRMCDYLHTEAAHWHALVADAYTDVERPLWRMRLYRFKRSALDQAAKQFVSAGNCPERPVVLGIGDAKFAATGKGEQSVPTTGLTRALVRAARRSNRCVLFTALAEHLTTRMCCACCAETTQPELLGKRGKRDRRDGRSRRLRLCTLCNTSGGKRRDRDVQAARNILWLLFCKYFGVPRPEYLCLEEELRRRDAEQQPS